MASTSSSFRLNAVIPVLLILLVFAAFFRNITAGFVWDDWFVLVGNPRFNPPTFASIAYYWTHITWNLYQPLTCTAWAILSKISYVDAPDGSGNHLNPTTLHLGCIILHALTTLALYRLLRLLTSTTWSAAIGAAIFAVHPIQVEAVAFIGVINNPLSTGLSLLAITDYLQAKSVEINAARRRWLWWRGTLLFLLAMLAKPIAVIVPAIAMVLDAARDRRPYRALIASALPWFLLALPFAVGTKLNQHGAIASAQAPPWVRPLIAGDTLAVQIFHILFPIRLAVDYGRTPAYLMDHPIALMSGLLTLALIALAWKVRSSSPLLAAAIAIFILSLLPNSGLVPFDFQQFSTVADRYVYLGMIGPALAVTWLLSRYRFDRLIVPSCIAVTILLGLTIHQTGYWQDDLTLFSHALRINPGSELAEGGVVSALLNADSDAADVRATEFVRRFPKSAKAHELLGLLQLKRGRTDEAIDAFRQTVRLDPSSVPSHKRLGRMLDDRGSRDDAIHEYRIALQIQSDDPEALSDLAAIYAESGHPDLAVGLYQAALRSAPRLAAAQIGLEHAKAALVTQSTVK